MRFCFGFSDPPAEPQLEVKVKHFNVIGSESLIHTVGVVTAHIGQRVVYTYKKHSKHTNRLLPNKIVFTKNSKKVVDFYGQYCDNLAVNVNIQQMDDALYQCQVENSVGRKFQQKHNIES